MKTLDVRYGVTQTDNGSFQPVVFVGGQTSSYSMNTRRTPKGALRLAENWVKEIEEEKKKFGITVNRTKWTHSVI